ncbi:MAG: SdpI family protein [Lachnospiraceae bacterium]|nr:SdpI family protein [Lachnospiraceae bacterium]
MKNDKKIAVLPGLICLIPLIAGAFLYGRMPEQMPIHFNAAGEVDNYASRAVALFVLPGLLFVLTLFMPAIMKMDPKYDNMSPALRTVILWTLPAVELICSGITMASALGYDVAVELIVPFIFGLLFIVIGNYLPKTKQSYTMGIKLPWTLDSEENWNRTHRLAGFLWVIGGVLFIIAAFLKLDFWVDIVILLIMVLVPTVYSYVFYRRSYK